MSTTGSNGSQFRGAFMGYNKADVDSYVARTEAEMKNREDQKEEWEQQKEEWKQQVAQLNAEIELLKKDLDAKQEEQQELLDKNELLKKLLKKSVEDMKQQEVESEKKYEKLEEEYRDFQERIEAEGANPKTIQDAILNAQRMSEIVIVEAQQKALEIREKAKKERREQEEEGRLALEDARREAARVQEEAEQKCDDLQRTYDRILLDVTGFKAEMMGMYRRHMALLAALPEKKGDEIEVSGDLMEEDVLTMDVE